MNKFLIYVNDEREALKMAKDFIFSFKKEMCDISQSNNKQGYIVLLINNSNFIYIVYDRNVILNNIISEKDFNRYRVYTTVYNTALLEAASLFATEMQSDDILKSIKRDLQACAYKGCINLQSLIKDVKFNPPATIVFWNDGTKTIVKSSEFDDYDPEKGFMLCVMKYLLKPQLTEDKKLRSYYKTITDYTDKFEEEEYVPGEWPEGFLRSLFNFTLDNNSHDGDKSTEEPNLTYEKGINPELKVDENIEDTKSMINIIFENANKELKNLDKKALNGIYGSRDNIDAKKFLHSIVNNIRNDKFNFVRFHGKRPNDIKVEEVNYNHVYREQFVDNIKYVSVIQCCNLEILEKILSNIYHLTTAEIILYHTNNYDEFMIVSNNTAIIFLNNELDAACFYNLLVDNVQKHFLPLEDARSFIDYPYFQKYISDIIAHIIDIKGKQ